MLYIIGIGLGDEKDISVKGLEIVRSCSRVYLESYTSILSCGRDRLQEYYGTPVVEMDREAVEQGCEDMLHAALSADVAFLVVGDAFSATTHSDLFIRARELGVSVRAIFNASIMTAVGASGLQLYRFGQTVSLVFWTDSWKPDSYYEKIKQNRAIGLHTLCLLDIKVKEQTTENLLRGRKVYEPPRYMTCAQAAAQLLEIEENRKEGAYSPNTYVVACCRMGTDSQCILACKLREMAQIDLGGPLHTLVLCGDLHLMELEMLRLVADNPSEFDDLLKDQKVITDGFKEVVVYEHSREQSQQEGTGGDKVD
eukprot:ANDGO_02095.mRNA.1 Diphthine methyl ester synthase